jgi:hypothetical protein
MLAVRWSALLRRTAAAIFGQIVEQRIHRLESCRIDHRTALTLDPNKPGLPQPVEMKCERIWSQTKRVRNSTGGHSFWSGLNQQPEHVQSIVLRKGGQCCYGITLFHISADIE